jgi:hypothetical protein
MRVSDKSFEGKAGAYPKATCTIFWENIGLTGDLAHARLQPEG